MEFLLMQIKLNLPPKLIFKIFFPLLSLIGKASTYYLGIWYWMQTSEFFGINYYVMFYNWITCSLGLGTFIPLSVQIGMKKKKLPSTHFIPVWKPSNYGTNLQFIYIPQSIPPQSSILEIFENNQHSELINHLLVIFKFFIYSVRNTKQLNFDNLKITTKKIKEIVIN